MSGRHSLRGTARRAPRRGRDPGTDLAGLHSAYGLSLPAPAPAAAVVDLDEQDKRLLAGSGAWAGHGTTGGGRGWSAVTDPLSVYTANTAQVGGLFPLVGSDSLPPWGAPVGVDVDSGCAFYADPIGWILNDLAENPNVHVTGKPGRGKSATIKKVCFGLMRFGYRTLVPIDLKDEYVPLADRVGGATLTLGPGLTARVNPLDMGPQGASWGRLTEQARHELGQQIFARWVLLLEALAAAAGAQVSASDSAALTAVLDELTGWRGGTGTLSETTIPAVWTQMCNPTDQVWQSCRYASRQDFLEATRVLTDALGQMVKVALAGMFDAPTNIAIDWDAPIVSLSGRRILETNNPLLIGTAITCMNAWSSTLISQRPAGQHTVVPRDESWRQMRLGVKAVEALDESLRLSRTQDVVNVLIGHKPGDAAGVGDSGSQAVNIASEMVSLCDTKIMLGQDAGIADRMAAEFDLPDLATAWIKSWAMTGKGRAVWMIGSRLYRVSTVLTPLEQQLFHTNDNLVSTTPADASDTPGHPAGEPVDVQGGGAEVHTSSAPVAGDG